MLDLLTVQCFCGTLEQDLDHTDPHFGHCYSTCVFLYSNCNNGGHCAGKKERERERERGVHAKVSEHMSREHTLKALVKRTHTESTWQENVC